MNVPVTLIIALALPTLTWAAPFTVTWGAQNAGGAVASASGKELPAGCLVRLGFFDLPLDQVHDLAWDTRKLENHFTELARGAIGQFDGQSFPVSGAFAERTSLDLTSSLLYSAEGTACIWAYNSADAESATEIGIFSSPHWSLHPNQFGVGTWDLSQVGVEDTCVGSSGTNHSTTLGGPVHQLASLAVLADAADADGDGVVHLLEEAFGMNRESADAGLMPTAVIVESEGAARPGFRFRRRAGGQPVDAAVYEASGLRYTVEVSDDLNRWDSGSAACELVASTPIEDGYELVTFCPDGDASRPGRFFRVRIERL